MENEISTSRNIKDRLNRHNVTKTLTKILEFVKGNKYDLGIFIFAGYDEYNEFILETIFPEIENDKFYYSCSNKFNLDFIDDYIKTYDGSIIFANGNETIIYEWQNKFIKKKHINANLIKRHKKGGQSSVRFSRLAEESRLHYVTYIIDNLNSINTKNNYIFGSSEILNMIFERKKEIQIKLNNGGFINFDNNTINNQNHWLKYLNDKINYDKYYEKIIFYLETNPDYLDFDINNKNNMEYYMIKLESNLDNNLEKKIPIVPKDSKYYNKLFGFEYVGVKYYNYNNLENEY